MLSLRLIRRLATVSQAVVNTTAISSKKNSARNNTVKGNTQEPLKIDEPALFKLKNEKDPNKLFNLFKANAHNKIVVENRFAFEDTVSRLAGAHRFDYIEDLLEQQKSLPQGRREGFIVRIIMLYGKAGMIDHAVNTFYDMHLYGCRRTVKSFNATLKVLAQSRDLEVIESFLKEVPFKFGIDLDVLSINIVIKAFCEMEVLDKAYLVMVEMEKFGIIPDVVTFTTLISAFYKNNQWVIGNGLWNLMVLKGCLPNLATFNVRIQFLINHGRAWEANDLARLMHRLRIHPDEVTHNLLIKGFCKAGKLDMAKRVYAATKPNVKIYQTMIHYLCKAGDFDLAYTMCKDSMQKNWIPSVDSICRLLDGLLKAQKLSKAQFIITLVRKSVPRSSVEKLHVSIIRYLCGAGEFDFVYTICRNSLQKNRFLDVDTICSLVDGLHKDQKLEKAKCIIELAEKRKPPFPADQLNAMKSMLLKS